MHLACTGYDAVYLIEGPSRDIYNHTTCVAYTGLAQASPKIECSMHSVELTIWGKQLNWVPHTGLALSELSVQDTGVITLSAGSESI